MTLKSPNLLKKLTPEDVLKIKLLRADGWEKKDLMEKFNVSLTTIDWHIGAVNPPRQIIGDYAINQRIK